MENMLAILVEIREMDLERLNKKHSSTLVSGKKDRSKDSAYGFGLMVQNMKDTLRME